MKNQFSLIDRYVEDGDEQFAQRHFYEALGAMKVGRMVGLLSQEELRGLYDTLFREHYYIKALRDPPEEHAAEV